MKTTFITHPLTKEHLRPFEGSNITVVARLFYHPHHWYAGIIQDFELDETKLILTFKKSVRFERSIQKEVWLPETSLVRRHLDRSFKDSANKTPRLVLNEVEIIEHRLFKEGNGIIGIRHVEGYTHLSLRGIDVLSIESLLENT